jgi:PAS domain S-box-containing protein
MNRPAFSIARQLTLTLIGLVMASVLLTGGILVALSFQALRSQIELLQQTRAQVVSEQINAYVDDLQRKLTYLARVPGLTDLDANARRSLLEGLINQNKAYELVGITDVHGRLRQAVSPLGETPPQEWAATTAFRRTVLAQEDWVGPAELDGHHALPTLLLAVPIRNERNIVDGMLFARINLRFLWVVIEETQVGTSGYVYIIDRRQFVIAQSRRAANTRMFEDLSQHPLGSLIEFMPPLAPQTYRGLRNEEVIGAVSSIPATNWRVVVELPVAEANAPLRNLLGVMGGGLFAGLALAVGFSVVLARQLTQPLKQLTAAATRLKVGEFETRVEIRQQNELAVLANAFNHMAKRLETAVAQLQQDIDARKQVEEQLKQQAVWMQFTSDAVITTDLNRCIIGWNAAAQRIYGWPASEAIGKPLDDLLKTTFVDTTQSQAQEILQQTGLWQGQLRQQARSGQVIDVDVAVSYLKDNAGMVIGGIAINRDVTERKRAEEEKARLEAQFQQAQKMESVGRLAGGVAHDFNNMLGVIIGNAELALEEVEPSQPIYSDLAEIQKAAQRSANLTRQLLTFARKQAIAPRVLNLNETITGMMAMLARIIGENIELRWMPADDLWLVELDPTQIDQILANLCINARDAISDVGMVTIETSNWIVGESDRASGIDAAPGAYIMLAVSDTGCGMDAATRERIFEPFFTTKPVGQGTGLGLATVYGIVKQNNGFITVTSAPDQGSTFQIFLPRYLDPAHVAPDNDPEPRVAAEGGGETILLVEDEPALLRLVQHTLVRLGYRVLVAGTPGAARALAETHDGPIDLLMTDVIMPEMNGRTLGLHIKQYHPNIKILFMSGYTADVIAHHGILEEGVVFIQKPFTAQSLAARIREIIAP